jgi:hypothetical protein
MACPLNLRLRVKESKLPEVKKLRETYTFTRLCFKRGIIEPLGWLDEFRVITPVGTFQMSKEQFYEVFANVVKSRSYQQDGIYHYPTVPEKAQQFLL